MGFTCCVNKWLCNLTGTLGLPLCGKCRQIHFFPWSKLFIFRWSLVLMGPSTHDHNNPRTGSNQIMWLFYMHFRYVNFEKNWFTHFQSIYHSIIWHISCYFLNPLVLPCWVKWNKEIKMWKNRLTRLLCSTTESWSLRFIQHVH